MQKITLLMLIFFLGILLVLPTQSVFAVGPYTPIADAFTLLNDPNDNNGTVPWLFLSASNADGCVPSSYVWFKFQVPNPSATIAYATLSVPIHPVYDGDEKLDMELRSSPGVDWTEESLTWNNQPPLDPTVLATAPSTVAPNDALFFGDTFASYLNGKKGQTVSLVVKANCNGEVFIESTRVFAARENTDPQYKVELILQGPTNVNLVEMRAASRSWNGQSVLFAVFLGLAAALLMVRYGDRRKKK